MTKKDYIAFAHIFSSRAGVSAGAELSAREQVRRHYVKLSADLFAYNNQRFDRAAYYSACGVPSDTQGLKA